MRLRLLAACLVAILLVGTEAGRSSNRQSRPSSSKSSGRGSASRLSPLRTSGNTQKQTVPKSSAGVQKNSAVQKAVDAMKRNQNKGSSSGGLNPANLNQPQGYPKAPSPNPSSNRNPSSSNLQQPSAPSYSDVFKKPPANPANLNQGSQQAIPGNSQIFKQPNPTNLQQKPSAPSYFDVQNKPPLSPTNLNPPNYQQSFPPANPSNLNQGSQMGFKQPSPNNLQQQPSAPPYPGAQNKPPLSPNNLNPPNFQQTVGGSGLSGLPPGQSNGPQPNYGFRVPPPYSAQAPNNRAPPPYGAAPPPYGAAPPPYGAAPPPYGAPPHPYGAAPPPYGAAPPPYGAAPPPYGAAPPSYGVGGAQMPYGAPPPPYYGGGSPSFPQQGFPSGGYGGFPGMGYPSMPNMQQQQNSKPSFWRHFIPVPTVDLVSLGMLGYQVFRRKDNPNKYFIRRPSGGNATADNSTLGTNATVDSGFELVNITNGTFAAPPYIENGTQSFYPNGYPTWNGSEGLYANSNASDVGYAPYYPYYPLPPSYTGPGGVNNGTLDGSNSTQPVNIPPMMYPSYPYPYPYPNVYAPNYANPFYQQNINAQNASTEKPSVVTDSTKDPKDEEDPLPEKSEAQPAAETEDKDKEEGATNAPEKAEKAEPQTDSVVQINQPSALFSALKPVVAEAAK